MVRSRLNEYTCYLLIALAVTDLVQTSYAIRYLGATEANPVSNYILGISNLSVMVSVGAFISVLYALLLRVDLKSTLWNNTIHGFVYLFTIGKLLVVISNFYQLSL